MPRVQSHLHSPQITTQVEDSIDHPSLSRGAVFGISFFGPKSAHSLIDLFVKGLKAMHLSFIISLLLELSNSDHKKIQMAPALSFRNIISDRFNVL